MMEVFKRIKYENCNCIEGMHHNNGEDDSNMCCRCEKCDYWEREISSAKMLGESLADGVLSSELKALLKKTDK